MKEYNQWELRFLQVLVPKKRYFEILKYHYHLVIDRALFHGTIPIKIHPDDKIEFVNIRNKNEINSAATDYLDSVNCMIKSLKKHGVPKMNMGWAIISEEANENDN